MPDQASQSHHSRQLARLRNRICEERQMVASFDCGPSRAFDTRLRRQNTQESLFRFRELSTSCLFEENPI